MNRQQVQTKRDRLRAADDELTRATTLLSVLGEYVEKYTRGARTDPDTVTAAFDRFIDPGPMAPADRRTHLSYITNPFRDGKDFVTFAKDRITNMSPTSSEGTSESLRTLVDGISQYQGGSGKEAATDPFDALIEHGTRELSENLVTVISLLAEAARAERDAARAELNNDYPDEADDGQTIEDEGAIQQFVEATDDPIESFDEHPIALLPVKLETRFVRPPDDNRQKTGVRNPELYDDIDEPQLWVRVYPDSIHIDNHEPALTDDEIRLAKDFWAYCWYSTHESLPVDSPNHSTELAYLQDHLDSRRGEVLAGLDANGFPNDPIERKKRIKERAWNQLIDRFGRERAAYIVHELAPDANKPSVSAQGVTTKPQVLLSLGQPSADGATDTVGGQPVSDIPGIKKRPDVPDIVFPKPERKPETWTQPPKARLLPDQWLVYGVWRPDGEDGSRQQTDATWDVREDVGTDDDITSVDESDGSEGDEPSRHVFYKWTDAVREDLPIGPTPEQVAMAQPDVGTSDGENETGSNGGDEALEWLTDFGDAEKAGMAFRITDSDLFDDPSSAPAITDGTFETLVVTGVKSSMDHKTSADELRELFEAHHYTDGLEFLELGTPTNNFDTASGYSSDDDPTESMAIETRAESFVEHGDNTDGDRLARALAIDPDSGDDGHVFGRVQLADKTEWLDGWHMRSALWPATASYYLQNMLVPNWLADLESLWGDDTDPYMDDVADMLGWHEAYGRHFIDYVTPMGQLSSFRVDRQPYGVLPVTPFADAHEEPFGEDPYVIPELTVPGETNVSDESRQVLKDIERSIREGTTADWLSENGDSSREDDDESIGGGDDD